MGAVLGHNQRLGGGQIEHLARSVIRCHRLAQRRAASGTAAGEMIDRGIRGGYAGEGLAGMTLLPAGLAACALAQAADTRRLLR